MHSASAVDHWRKLSFKRLSKTISGLVDWILTKQYSQEIDRLTTPKHPDAGEIRWVGLPVKRQQHIFGKVELGSRAIAEQLNQVKLRLNASDAFSKSRNMAKAFSSRAVTRSCRSAMNLPWWRIDRPSTNAFWSVWISIGKEELEAISQHFGQRLHINPNERNRAKVAGVVTRALFVQHAHS